jgi:hypothetical protein
LAGNLDWFVNTGVDVMTDTTRKGVGLLTMLTNELRLVKLAGEEWDSLTSAQLSEALAREGSGLTEEHARHISKVYVLQTNTPLPLTLGFRTGGGAEGVLQLLRFGEGSQPPVTLRYKLVERDPDQPGHAPEKLSPSASLPRSGRVNHPLALVEKGKPAEVHLARGVWVEVLGILRNPPNQTCGWGDLRVRSQISTILPPSSRHARTAAARRRRRMLPMTSRREEDQARQLLNIEI